MKKIIGNKIKTLRHSRGLQQNELVELLNISQASLSSYENGKKLPSIDLLVQISKYFDVSLEWLCGLENQSTFCTGADFINTFLKIKDLPGFSYDIRVDWEEMGIGQERYKTALFFTGTKEDTIRLEPREIFNVNAFSEFMRDYDELEKKLLTLGDKELTEDYKKMWLEKKLQEYANYKIVGEE